MYPFTINFRVLVLLLFLVGPNSGGKLIKSLPGYAGDLRFTLETGYVGLGNKQEVQLFYYFVHSERNPTHDPILLWITGGPGCSSLRALFFENGPLAFDSDNYSGGFPKLVLNPYSWTKGLNIIYLDGPVGTGFSYSRTPQGYFTSDYKFAANINDFLQKWLLKHPKFLKNEIYIGGDGYSGNPIPIAVQNILDGNKAGLEPLINIKGYVLGNPGTDFYTDFNSRTIYAHQFALVSDEIYEAAKKSCNDNFLNPSTEQCKSDMKIINELISNIDTVQILEPACRNVTFDVNSTRRYFQEKSKGSTNLKWCRKYLHTLCDIWVNDEAVQKALYVQKGTKNTWESCNNTIDSVSYVKDVSSVVGYHQNLTKFNIQGLIYSGDHDMEISYIATQKWIWSLNLTLSEKWRVWSVDDEIAGYTRKFSKDHFNLTYATVKGAGHFAPEYKLKECSQMVDRWMTKSPL